MAAINNANPNPQQQPQQQQPQRPPPIPNWLKEHCSRLQDNLMEFHNLNLNIRQLNPNMMKALCKALNYNDTIKIINMVSSFSAQVDPNACILEFLQSVLNANNHASLEIVHFSYNHLTNIDAIGGALAANTTLQELYLDYNHLNCSAAKALAFGLERNTSLRVLKLGSNKIGDEGGQALGRALSKNRSLTTLSLCRNPKLGWETGKAMYIALMEHNNDTLTSLEIAEGNPHVPNGKTLEHFVKANEAGRYLIHRGDTPLGLWPLVLAKAPLAMEPGLGYFFIRERPDLVGAN